MRIEKLKEFDSTLETFRENGFDGNIEKITTVDEPKAGGMFFVKDEKFFTKMVEALEQSPDKNFIAVAAKGLAGRIADSKVGGKLSLVLTAADVSLSMCKLSKVFYDEMTAQFDDINDGRETSSIDSTSKIAPNVFIGKNVKIGAGVVIHAGCSILSGASIDDNTVLYPSVTIYQNVKIGKNCRIHSGTIIGSDGFGYNFDKGIHHKIWHMGSVEIGNDVEIGASTTVDGGTFSPTRIGDGSKIDNGVQIGHNCNLKQGVILCGHTALAGSCTLGNYVVFGGKSGIAPDLTLEDGCQVAGGSLVSKSWPAGSKLAGHPARSLRDWLKGNAFVHKGAKGRK